MFVWSRSVSVHGEEGFKVSGFLFSKIRTRVSRVDGTKGRLLLMAEIISLFLGAPEEVT